MKQGARYILVFILVLPFIFSGCSREKPVEKYYRFGNTSWSRFNILRFEFPIEQKNSSYDVFFDLHVTKIFSHDELPLNMVLNTPSGEERIKEYQVKVQNKDGSFPGECSGDSCCVKAALKRGLFIPKTGLLRIEIENLTPRLETEGVLSAGIILVKH
jgi:gliding motility-associated lipoprotein GldH